MRWALLALALPLASCGYSRTDPVGEFNSGWVHTKDTVTGIELACFVQHGYESLGMHCVVLP